MILTAPGSPLFAILPFFIQAVFAAKDQATLHVGAGARYSNGGRQHSSAPSLQEQSEIDIEEGSLLRNNNTKRHNEGDSHTNSSAGVASRRRRCQPGKTM